MRNRKRPHKTQLKDLWPMYGLIRYTYRSVSGPIDHNDDFGKYIPRLVGQIVSNGALIIGGGYF